MITVERISEIAACLRQEGATVAADDLTHAHDGVFSGTELAMRWRFHLAKALELSSLSAATRQQVKQVWNALDATLS
jgi:hypothetical protein